MLFNSYVFILLFLPFTILVFYLLGARRHHRVAISWLVGSSVFFYGWWAPKYLELILISVLFNYSLGVALSKPSKKSSVRFKLILAFGISCNLVLLGYFKYTNFLVDNLNFIFNTRFEVAPIILPLAISFFTFQQIAYLVDAYRKETREHNFLHYCLFVTFFPQLIAGPIVHHKEILHQFAKDTIYRFSHKNFSIGVTIFVIGLSKKVLLADTVSIYSTPIFQAASEGQILTFFEAWSGSLAYSLQLYFDFSGYSDMAIGLGLLFGIQLPINFNSPYKAVNIIDFWRRWHITLSRFLRDYLYFSLGGNRRGPIRRYLNLIITMLLGGLWHGAGWTFVIWGGLHGFYLILNHLWISLRQTLGHNLKKTSIIGRFFSRSLTFLAVVVGWIFFRSDSLPSALRILEGMVGFNGIKLPGNAFVHYGWSIRVYLESLGWTFSSHNNLLEGPAQLFIISGLLIIAWTFPNTQTIISKAVKPLGTKADHSLSLKPFCYWQPTLLWASIISVLFFICLLQMSTVSEFLYFKF